MVAYGRYQVAVMKVEGAQSTYRMLSRECKKEVDVLRDLLWRIQKVVQEARSRNGDGETT